MLNASKSRLNGADDLMGYANAYSMLGRHSDAIELGRRAILAAKDDPNIAMGYVGVFLAAGDEFEKTPEQISVFQETLSTFKERFPTSPHLQRFTIDPERPLDAIRDTLVRMEQQTRDVVKFYRENRMPLRMFAKLLGRDLYETWVQVIAIGTLFCCPLREPKKSNKSVNISSQHAPASSSNLFACSRSTISDYSKSCGR